MSVEEAWLQIAYWLNAREFACLDGSHTDSLRDRLILEVQAEMPCYRMGLLGAGWDGDSCCDHLDRGEMLGDVCSPCLARRQLTAVLN